MCDFIIRSEAAYVAFCYKDVLKLWLRTLTLFATLYELLTALEEWAFRAVWT
jgi:hypothetical protein